MPLLNLKKFTKNNFLKLYYWDKLNYLYNYFKTFYKAIIIVKGCYGVSTSGDNI